MVDEKTAPTESRSGAPTREYVVLERVEFEDDDRVFFVIAHKVEARNGTNALRRAFKEIRQERAEEEPLDEATLAVVPMSQWKPTPVRAKKRESITVDIG